MAELEQAIRESARDGSLPCTGAFSIAKRLGIAPDTVGQAADALNVRISLCQLGLFGYDAFGERRVVRKLPLVPASLRRTLAEAAVDGRAPCVVLWQLADENGVPRLLVGSAAETDGITVARCQLGCFE